MTKYLDLKFEAKPDEGIIVCHRANDRTQLDSVEYTEFSTHPAQRCLSPSQVADFWAALDTMGWDWNHDPY